MINDGYKKGQMIWWDIFEYHTMGMLDDGEFAELMDTIYYFRTDKEKYSTLKLSPKVELIWKTLKNNISKSEQNHNQYKKKKDNSNNG